MIIIFMGVCGCGKTSVGEETARRLGWQFRDADEFHSQENKQKMLRGVPLTDEDRIPWLKAINEQIRRWHHRNTSGVLTCSALCRRYRELLLGARYREEGDRSPEGAAQQEIVETVNRKESNRFTKEDEMGVTGSHAIRSTGNSCHGLSSANSSIVFVHLKGSIELIASRMSARQGHFMPVTLLQSQFDTLEEPADCEPAVSVSVDCTLDKVVERVLKSLSL